jgi:hypothetical protein
VDKDLVVFTWVYGKSDRNWENSLGWTNIQGTEWGKYLCSWKEKRAGCVKKYIAVNNLLVKTLPTNMLVNNI